MGDKHARLDPPFINTEGFDQEIVLLVFSGNNLPLILTHGVYDDVIQLADGRSTESVSRAQ